jgi:RNA polymerase sigma-70 factor (ECF subfamily)
MSAPPAIAVPLDAPADERRDRLAALFDAHEDRLYRLARRLTANQDEARDLVQDTFIRIARSWRSVPAGAAREEAWLVRVLVNIRRDEWRKTTVRKRAAAALRADLEPSPATPESMLIARQSVWTALDRLHPRRRAILVMHELDGSTVAGIASCFGVSTMTVRWHLSMARRELRAALAPHRGGGI